MTYSENLHSLEIANQKRIILPQNIEYLLLSLVAGIGLIGSIYIFASNAVGQDNNNFNQFAAATTIEEGADEEVGSFNRYVKVSGKKEVNSEIFFETKMDISEKRYVMEMGDGMRMIITQPEFSYRYAEKGKYLLELKTIERGLITTVATKTLKIK